MIQLGMVIGLLVGLTGMGSGSLLTPLLILLGGMLPATAVGTSLAFSFTTKLYGSWTFYRRGQVKMEIVRALSLGGLPGVLFGAFVIRYLGVRRPEVMNVFLLRAIGLVLIIVSVLMIARLLPLTLRPAVADEPLPLTSRQRRMVIVLIGFVAGASVTVTSIGSGAALIPAMILFYRLDSGTLVGTNMFLGTILAAVAGIPHADLGNVEWKGVAGLLCGSVPALWLASQLHGRVPRQIPEGIIAAALMAMGVHIIFF
jgi:uncharacterized membrane protein YfcA